MSPSSTGFVIGAAVAVVLGVIFSAWGGAGVAILVAPAALIFGAAGALIGLIGSRLRRRDGRAP